jgi:hypothetical protein
MSFRLLYSDSRIPSTSATRRPDAAFGVGAPNAHTNQVSRSSRLSGGTFAGVSVAADRQGNGKTIASGRGTNLSDGTRRFLSYSESLRSSGNRGRFSLLLAVAASLHGFFGAGCGNKDTACVPRQQVACVSGQACANGATAYQVCKDDGSAYGDCVCGGGSDGGTTKFPPSGAKSGLIGAACEAGDNCRKGLECVPSSAQFMNSEGPSGGLCLARCVPGHDFCNTLDSRAKCKVLDDRGTPTTDDDIAYCFPGCKLGIDKEDPDKCRSRRDVVCTEMPTGSGEGICIPVCRGDVDCSPRFCDIGTGLCADAAPTGSIIGAACDPQNPTCAGQCIPYLASYAECSGLCSYGEPGACGQTRTDPPYDFFCYSDAALGSGPGDLGYCARACDCDTLCDRPDAVCEPTPDVAGKTGRAGICGSKLLPSGAPRKNLPCSP